MAMEGDKAGYTEVPPEVQQNESPPRKSSPPPGFPPLHVFFIFFYMHIYCVNLIFVRRSVVLDLLVG